MTQVININTFRSRFDPKQDVNFKIKQGKFNILEGYEPIILTPGEYELQLNYFETGIYFHCSKVTLWFTVMSPGEHFELLIPCYYSVSRLIGDEGKGGKFKVRPHSDFARDFKTLFCSLKRLDRAPMSYFLNKIIIGEAETVTSSGRNKKLPKNLQYSKIGKLLRLKSPGY